MRLPFDPRTQVLAAFATPIGKFAVPNAADINPGIEQAILDREGSTAGKTKSNHGGWHSDNDFLDWGLPEIDELADSMRSAVASMVSHVTRTQRFNIQMQLGAWANVNRAGDYNRTHNHPDHHWSGVYYVRAGDYSAETVNKAGFIELRDPRGAVNMMNIDPAMEFGSTVGFPPMTGMMLLFPSWLYHEVNAFVSDQVRISVAFNARISRFERTG